MKAFLASLADQAERFLLDSGLLDQLSYIVTKTTALRSLVLAASASAVAHGVINGNLTESTVAALATILTAAANQFIAHVHAKYGQRVQASVGALPDGFVGPETLKAVQQLVFAASPGAAAAISEALDPK